MSVASAYRSADRCAFADLPWACSKTPWWSGAGNSVVRFIAKGMDEDQLRRDHHPNCFTYWLAGGGVKAGFSYGKTDDYSVNKL